MLSKPTTVFMNMAIHEAFHAFQGSYWQAYESDQEGLNRDFYAACVKNAVWSQAYFSELDLWALHMEELVGAETIDQLSLVKIAQQVLTNRESSGKKDKVTQQCWDSNAKWEWTEGTAWYVESEMKQLYGLQSPEELVDEFKNYLYINRKNVSADEDAAFYASGALIVKLIAKLAVDESWTLQIENGKSPEQVLEKIIEKL